MSDLQCAIPAQGQELERLAPILDGFIVEARALAGSASSMKKNATRPKLEVAEIDRVAQKHFPLCMKQLHCKLRENHHLKYDGRVQYRMFLKGAGFSVHECIQFFRKEFTKAIPADRFDKEYTYHIRHSYGLEGSRKDYAPLDCEQIIEVVNNAIAKVMHVPVEKLGQVTPADVRKKTKKEKQLLKQQKMAENANNPVGPNQPLKKKKKREFNMSNYTARALAVKFLYLGEKYAGFARQDHMPETVERYLLEALVRSKLIENVDNVGYSRCGRTDRGVSAFGQVVALRIRSNMPATAELLSAPSIDDVRPGEKFQVRLESGEVKTLTELDYASHINRALPADIRVYSVASCRPEFSARFDCKARMYRYFFVRRDLDIEKMRAAAQYLVGKHDFRNFCRIDPNCHVYERNVRSFEIVECPGQRADDPSQQMFRCEVFGRAFLWHQVRCMVEVLFLIGSGQEDPSIIPKLLDIAQTPRKPQYDMASDLPLVLHDCYFADPDDAEGPGPRFEYTPLALLQVHAQLTETWEKRCVQAAMLRSHLDTLEAFRVDARLVVNDLDHYAPKLEQLMRERKLLTNEGGIVQWKDISPLLPLSKKRKTLPLAKRDTGHSVDERKRIAQERKRRREEGEDSAMQAAKEVRTESGEHASAHDAAISTAS
ncbi:tRNA pseudouridine(38-40) synthase [Phytophthora cinnamomi]|uniref:tRNA pseudouridine(38-40) synthase n=1 Tax=Phytophthora cinnamomi TaxID=4785 RepID=UPI00355A6021|nr:tRNA pseudouridine(38-40) synthase [Phytophthora cinnamomi]